jgi:S-DNA-T family DNA segregation ATPase FtsK/SpoIIIE
VKSLKVTLRTDHGGHHRVDLVLDVDPGATVGDVARTLTARDPRGAGDPATPSTLAVDTPAGPRPAVAATPMERSGIRSGATVAVTPAGTAHPDADLGREVATLEVRGGPDAGGRFPLRRGDNLVGRDHTCDVRLSDPLVSKHHARITVTDVVEIVDLDSSNGVYVGGGQVGRARLRPDDTALLGDTLVTVAAHGLVTGGGDVRPAIEFNRSPRLDPTYEGVRHTPPEPPRAPAGRRFPIVAFLVPMLMGAGLYALTGSPFALVFVAFGPLTVGGAYAEDAVSSRRAHRRAVAAFRAALVSFEGTLRAAADTERAHRRREHPSVERLVGATERLTPLLWTRRPEHERFLDLRLGLGRLSTRDTAAATDPDVCAVVAAYSTVDGVPVVCRLTDSGGLGVAGTGALARQVVWGIVAQLVTLHSPADVVLAAVVSGDSAHRWDWLKWLPHTTSHHSPLGCAHLVAGGAASTTLVGELDDLVSRRAAGDAPAHPAVVVLVEDDADADRRRLVDLAERGPAHRVHVVWTAAGPERLPAACRCFVDVDAGAVGYTHTGAAVTPVAFEPVRHETVEELARRLAPVVDAGARVYEQGDLPTAVSFVALAGAAVDAAPDAVVERWRETGARQGLRALVGAAGTGAAFHLDLCAHGPHALVGGTTGAGKSELLQSWILGMATAHSPERVTFLLVDYKGGAAFGACAALPHAVGLVTDLDRQEVRRALTSLRAELTHRELLLSRYHVKDLADLERTDPAQAPPRLVIVVDEFAALRQEIPEFVDGVVDVAQRGRSLGLHLILATQRPAGVITDNLRANTNLRVALRMADESDSTDVLGSPVAAAFDPGVPGRAVAKTGPGRLTTFQTAYVGGWTGGGPEEPRVEIATLGFGPGTAWSAPPTAARPSTGAPDLVRVVDTVRAAAERSAIPAPRRPWLPPLPAFLDLYDLVGTDPGVVVLGLRDVAAEQAQPPAAFHPDRDGNLVVYGTGGTGKSTLLRTLALSAVLGDTCHVYGIEYGARGLSLIEELPQVGAIVRGEDTERVGRLLGDLCALIDERTRRFGAARAPDLTTYRLLGGLPEPRVLLLLDGMAAFGQQYPPGALDGVFEKLVTLAADGRQAGVHLVVSADRPASVPGALSASLQRRVVLRLAGDPDYGALGLRGDVIAHDAPPGRGLFGGPPGDEVQVAVLGGAGPGDQHRAVRDLAARSADTPPAPPVRTLPTRVRRGALTSTVDLPVLGVERESLAAVSFTPSGAFLLAGPAGSGRSTAVLSIVEELRRWRRTVRLYRLGGRVSAGGFDGWHASADGAEAVRELATALALEVTAWAGRPTAIVVESTADLAFGPAEQPCVNLLKTALDLGAFVLLEGETATMSGSSGLHQLARSRRTGLILQPQVMHGQHLLQSDFPRGLRQADFPPGRGMYVVRGRPSVVQVALPDRGPAGGSPYVRA